jgi:ABC-type dipeptide/oligopeptide/nickel transport system permease subunit
MTIASAPLPPATQIPLPRRLAPRGSDAPDSSGLTPCRAQSLDARGSGIVSLLVLAAMLAPLIATHDPMAQDLWPRVSRPPSAAHWLGTDQLGRDLYSRLLYGARPTLLIVALVIALAAPFGVAVGSSPAISAAGSRRC